MLFQKQKLLEITATYIISQDKEKVIFASFKFKT